MNELYHLHIGWPHRLVDISQGFCALGMRHGKTARSINNETLVVDRHHRSWPVQIAHMMLVVDWPHWLGLVLIAKSFFARGLQPSPLAYSQQPTNCVHLISPAAMVSRRQTWSSCIDCGHHKMINQHRTWVSCIVHSLYTMVCWCWTWQDNIGCMLQTFVCLYRTWPAKIIQWLHTLDFQCRMCPASNVRSLHASNVGEQHTT